MYNSPGPRITFQIDEKLKQQIKMKALKEGKTIKEVTTELLIKWLTKK